MASLNEESISQTHWHQRYSDRSDLERESLEAARTVEGCAHLERIEIRLLNNASIDHPNWIPMRFHPEIPLSTKMEALAKIKPLWIEWRLRAEE